MQTRRSLFAAALAVALAPVAAFAADRTATFGNKEVWDQVLGRGDGLPFPPVPPIPSEEVPPAPYSQRAQLWHPGDFDWNGKSYDWTPGRWIEHPGAEAAPKAWLRGHWVQDAPDSRHYTWVPGAWQR